MADISLPQGGVDFEALYRREADTVYRICYMYLRNPADTEDAVQSVFLKLLNLPEFKEFDSAEHEKAWLIKTAGNHCKDMLKSHGRTRNVALDTLPDLPYEDGDLWKQNLLAEVLTLPGKYKIVLYLYYFEGYSVKEISKMLSVKESTLQTQLAKGRELLKISIGGDYCG